MEALSKYVGQQKILELSKGHVKNTFVHRWNMFYFDSSEGIYASEMVFAALSCSDHTTAFLI